VALSDDDIRQISQAVAASVKADLRDYQCPLALDMDDAAYVRRMRGMDREAASDMRWLAGIRKKSEGFVNTATSAIVTGVVVVLFALLSLGAVQWFMEQSSKLKGQ
jgi:hypothetical protein